MKEYTFVMIKPDGFRADVIVSVFDKFLKNGLSIQNVDITKLDENFCKEHYSHLVGKDFYAHLQEFMTSGYVVPMMVTGENAVNKVREIIGATNPNKALDGTIRAIYGNKEDITYNVIHASDSRENARIEIDRINNYKSKKLIKK